MYTIICDKCGAEYGQFSELYQLDRGHYRITRYEHEYNETLENGKMTTICLCPRCESKLDEWMQLGIPKNSTDILMDENFGLPKRKE